MPDKKPSIPGYEVKACLGRGAMGDVHRALELATGEEVAIKRIRAGRARDPSWRGRFMREATILARVDHPNIARLRRVLEFRSDLYIVMECVEGVNLREWIAPGGMGLAEAIGVCVRICRGLQAAHEAGVIHRDVKPDNVRIDLNNQVKLLDFGLARSTEDGAVDQTGEVGEAGATEDGRTVHGAVVGTPGYMAPEQARGEPVDVRADVYSLGCVLFECLTGFRARRPDGERMHGPDWSLLPPTVPGELAGLLRACLAEERTDRPPGVDHVRFALETIATGLGERGRHMLAEIGADVCESGRRTGSAGGSSPNNLPGLAPMVGRGAVIADLDRQLDRMRLVTIAGIGGGGKTTVALHLARQLADAGAFADGVHLVKLAGVNAARQVPAAVAAVLGVREAPGVSLTRGICDELRDKTALLVLDNCEHVAPACVKLIHEILAAAPGVKVLATGREPLGAQAEQVYSLLPMATVPHTGSGEERSEAADLFICRASAAWMPQESREGDAARIESICRRSGGLPLAIELSATLMEEYSLAEIDEKLASDPAFADRKASDREEQGRLEAAIRWSMERLSPKELRLLLRLARFPVEFTHEAAERIGADAPGIGDERIGRDEVLGMLLHLSRRSLLYRLRTREEFEEGAMRFGVLELVRGIALRMPMDSREGAECDGRFLSYFDELSARRALVRGRREEAVFGFQKLDFANVRRALELSRLDGADADVGVRLANSLSWYWYQLWAPTEGLAWLEPALERRRRQRPDLEDVLQARGYSNAAMMMWMIGGEQLGRAAATYRRSLRAFESAGERRDGASVRGSLGLVLQDLGQVEDARKELEASVSEFRALCDQEYEAQARLNLALLEMREQRYERAKEELDRCLPEFERSSDLLRGSATLTNLGVVEYRTGRPREGLVLLRRANSAAARANNGYGVANTADMAGLCCWKIGKLKEAAELFGFADAQGITNLRSNAKHMEDHRRAEAEIARELGDDAFKLAKARGRTARNASELIPEPARDA